MAPITFTFASPHIIVVLTPPVCISSLNSGFQTRGPGTPRLNHALVCLRPQTTGLPPFMTSSERPTCTVSHLRPLSGPTANLSTMLRKARKTRWSQICCLPRTTQISHGCGASRINLLMSRMHSTTILSRYIGSPVTNLSMEDPRRALTVKAITPRTEVTPTRAPDALLQYLTIAHTLSTLIRLEPSLPRTTPLGMSLVVADAQSCD